MSASWPCGPADWGSCSGAVFCGLRCKPTSCSTGSWSGVTENRYKQSAPQVIETADSNAFSPVCCFLHLPPVLRFVLWSQFPCAQTAEFKCLRTQVASLLASSYENDGQTYRKAGAVPFVMFRDCVLWLKFATHMLVKFQCCWQKSFSGWQKIRKWFDFNCNRLVHEVVQKKRGQLPACGASFRLHPNPEQAQAQQGRVVKIARTWPWRHPAKWHWSAQFSMSQINYQGIVLSNDCLKWRKKYK